MFGMACLSALSGTVEIEGNDSQGLLPLKLQPGPCKTSHFKLQLSQSVAPLNEIAKLGFT